MGFFPRVKLDDHPQAGISSKKDSQAQVKKSYDRFVRCVPLVMVLLFSCGAAFAGEMREFSETGAEIYSKA